MKASFSAFFFIDYFLSFQDRRTALHWACSAGHTNIVEFLLDLGVEVNLQDDVGLIVLIVHLANNHFEFLCVKQNVKHYYCLLLQQQAEWWLVNS